MHQAFNKSNPPTQGKKKKNHYSQARTWHGEVQKWEFNQFYSECQESILKKNLYGQLHK